MAKKGAKPSDRQIERIQWLHEQLRAGKYPSASDLAEHFDITPSTAYKDIKQFKVSYDPPLAYDGPHNGFYYEKLGFELPEGEGNGGAKAGAVARDEDVKVEKKDLAREIVAKATAQAAAARRAKPEARLETSELVSILAAEQLKRRYASSPFKSAIKSAYNKLAAMVEGETVCVDHESVERILTLDLDPYPSLDLVVFDALAKAIEDHETVVLKYFSGQKATVTDKPCDPYGILSFKDNWYLVAWCHEKQDYRDFLVNRVLSIEYPNLHFIPDSGFKMEKHKRSSQLFRGMGKPMRVMVEFDKFAAHWIRLRPVHATQKITERTDGSLELAFQVYSYENLLRWVLSFGEHARVLAPSDLQERVQKTIGRMNYLYNRF